MLRLGPKSPRAAAHSSAQPAARPKSPFSTARPGAHSLAAVSRPKVTTATARYLHSQIARSEETHRAPRRQVDEARAKERLDTNFDDFERVYAARDAALKSGKPWSSDAPTYVSNGTARTARTGMSHGSRGNSGDEWTVGDSIWKLPLAQRKTLMRMHGYREIITLMLDKVDAATRAIVVEMMRVETSQNRGMPDSIYKSLVRKGQETGKDEVGKFVNECKAANNCRNGIDCWYFANGCCIANHPPPKTPAKKSQKAPPAGKEKK